MSYDSYKAEALRFVDAKRALVAAIRAWADAVDADADLLATDAEIREPWANVQTAGQWAQAEAIRQRMHSTYAEMEACTRNERYALQILDRVKLAYYEAAAKEGR